MLILTIVDNFKYLQLFVFQLKKKKKKSMFSTYRLICIKLFKYAYYVRVENRKNCLLLLVYCI